MTFESNPFNMTKRSNGPVSISLDSSWAGRSLLDTLNHASPLMFSSVYDVGIYMLVARRQEIEKYHKNRLIWFLLSIFAAFLP
jgi:hypothetical protein